jgi:hypothetical protein
MAVKLATTNGNLTTAGTWQDVVNLRDYASSVQACDQTFRGATPVTPGAITIDGLVGKMGYRGQASPTGTFSIRLYNSTAAAAVAGTTVTINSSDVPITGRVKSQVGWYYFKFAAPVTLIAGNGYYPQAATSDINQQINIYYSGTNYAWAFGFVVNGASGAAPTTGDQVLILGPWTAAATYGTVTVTMDQTSSAVKYGTTSTTLESICIGHGGTLAWGTAAATNYYMNVQGIFWIQYLGAMTIGTVATPMPRDSTAILNFDITTSSGQYHMKSHGTFTMQGQSRSAGKNVVGCLLTANHTGGGTTFTVDRDTGWKSGDGIIVAGTLRLGNRADELTLSVDAGATTLTTGASSYDHLGDLANLMQAEVILTTRNVTMRVTTAGKNMTLYLDKNSSTDFDWASLIGISYAESSAYRGVCYTDPTALGIDYCFFDAFGDSSTYGISVASSGAGYQPSFDLTFTNNSFTRVMEAAYYFNYPNAATNLITIQDCWSIGKGTYSASAFLYWGHPGPIVIERCRIAGSYSANGAIRFGNTDRTGSVAAFGYVPRKRISNCVFHDTSNTIEITGTWEDNILIENCDFWRLKTTGSYTAAIYFASGSGCTDMLVDNCRFMSAQHMHVYHNTMRHCDVTWRDCKFGGESGYSTPQAFEFYPSGGQQGLIKMRFENCLFGDAAGGLFTDHTTGDLHGSSGSLSQYFQFYMINTKSGGTLFTSQLLSYFQGRGFIAYQREGQVLGTHRIHYPRLGTVARDATVYRSSPASEKLSPTTASQYWKLRSTSKRFDVTLGAQRSPSVWVRIDVSYNGNAPRLIMKANPAVGIDDDVVLATHSLVTATWVQLTGAMPTPSEDEGQLEVYVDCDGTAGNCWVDDWSI